MELKPYKAAIKTLQKAITANDKTLIQAAYDAATKLDWDNVPDSVFEKYDVLIDAGNEILLK